MEIRWVTWLLITLQLVKVIAGNDVITFNQDQEDLDDSIDAILEREQFIQVVPAHSRKPPHPPPSSNRQLKAAQNTSLLTDNSRRDSIRHRDAGRRQVTSSFQQQNTHKTYTSHPTGTKMRQRPGNVYNGRNTSTLPQRSQKNTIPVIMWEELLPDESGNQDELIAMENLLLPVGDMQSPHSRYKRQVLSLELPSGDNPIRAQITLSGSLTTEQAQDGSSDNQDLKNELSSALLTFLQGIYADITDINVTLLTSGSIVVDMEVIVNADDGALVEDVLLDVAEAFVTLDNVGDFRAGNRIYDVSKPIVQNITLTDSDPTDLQPAICYTCAAYQSCLQAADETYYCGLPVSDRFYPYGPGQGDSTLPREVEFTTAEITIDSGIPYGDQLYTSIYISVNGLISFDVPFAAFYPERLPSLDDDGNQRLLLAPYWSDLDLFTGDIGEVYYQLYQDAGNSNDAAIFARANSEVLAYDDTLSTYDASSVLVVTWYEIPPYPGEFSTDERVTFQCTIISDGQSTYVTYIYGIGAMNFNPVLQRELEIGWGQDNFAPENAQATYYDFDTIPGNTNENGLWFFKIGAYSNSAAKCLAWYNINLNFISDINFWNAVIPSCPCNQLVAALSLFWIPSFEQANCYDIFPLFGNIGRRCCYRPNFGGLETRIPDAGGLQLFTPYFGDLLNHYIFDTLPKQWCCVESNIYCPLYYQVRPQNNRCSAFQSKRGLFFGDPHIRTLDVKTYDFNGLGEYTLIKIVGYNNDTESSSLDFTLQGRTCQAQGSDGSLSRATVFCAIGVKNNNTNSTSGSSRVTTVSVEKSEYANGTNYMILFVNGQDYTVRFRDNENFARFDGGVYIRRENNSLRISTPNNIGLSVQINNGLLDFSVELDRKFNGATVGLMGNFNGNPNDDFVYPNGTVLPTNSSEREIFDFGQAWQITADESLFQYPFGLNASNFRNDSFTPIFLSEIASGELIEAEGVCGAYSPMTQACIFDYVATNDSNIATSTKNSEETFVEDDVKIENQAPSISGGGRINATVNQTTMVRFEATDPDNGSVSYSLVSAQNSAVLALDMNGVYEVSFTPTDSNSTEIAVVATDDKGVASEVAEVEIVQCSGCSGQGTCNFDKIKRTENPYFFKATCVCDVGYSGVDCEKDKNGCADNPCPRRTTCTDVAAVDEQATGRAYNCSGCPAGFQLNSNQTKCNDINECIVSPSICGNNSKCINTVGSYRCDCKSGYRKSSLGQCVDINECVENQYDCDQICINTIGSYRCECEEGFTLDAIVSTVCVNTSFNPCEGLTGGDDCSYGCRNVSGVAQCFCPLGRRLASDATTCEDIDECAERLCSQDCQNTDGSYQCSCFDGFVLGSDSLSCDPCPLNKFGPNCTKTCECRGHARLCDNVRGCICLDGWTGNNCERDVNECELDANICPEEKVCNNNNGSYTCDCPTGYQDISNNGSCYNINECLTPDVHGCDQGCIDNPGSYTCVCNEGYIYNLNTRLCEDIDECNSGVSGCEQLCDNMQGSYNCRCHPGFILDDDRKSCIEAEIDPCEGLIDNCDYGCIVEDGAPHCICRIGYQLSSNSSLCIDVNECELNNTCSDDCVNTLGSYSCSCPVGKKLQNDSRTCQVCDDYHWGENCANECACSPKGSQTCDPVVGCVCNTGWRGTQCNLDIDECSASPCDASAICTNTAGSYKCTCRDGYQLDTSSQECVDINECTTSRPCDHFCNNTIGSYICSCNSGFLTVGDECIDIDECASPGLNPCDQLCRNTQGDFMCECYPGYELNVTTRNTCARDPDAVSCLVNNTCSDFCRIEDGQDTCFCPLGYQLDVADNATCIDVDECDNNPCINGTCTNYDGGYNCSCSDGTKLAMDMITCRVCESGTYGTNCASICTCNATNTESCDPVDGNCNCSAGWEGLDCSTNIDECSSQSPDFVDCGSNANCIDLPGSYICVCNTGYFRSDDQCQACDATSYGNNCANTCDCITANTADCNDVNGICTCNSGWEGFNCATDINECQRNQSYCSGPLEVCVNLNGSARCDCTSGYARPNPSDNCQDIDECLLPTLVCTDNTKRCNNTEGSYDCVCKDGYLTNDDGSCTANFEEYIVQITIGYTVINEDWFNTATAAFAQLQQHVEEALEDYGRRVLGLKLLSVTVRNFYRGSVIANTSVGIDKLYSENPPADAARLLYLISNEGTLTIDGENVPIESVIPGASTDSGISDTSVCGFFNELTICSSNEVCSEGADGYPQCTADDSNYELIIGLGVGIPLFFILTVTIALLVYLYVKRRAKDDHHSSTPSVAREDPFSASVFATQMATKGSWGAPHRFQMYSPDAYSEAGTSDSSGNGGQLLKTRRSGRSDFQDSPWFESRGATPRDVAESRGAPTDTGGPTSNFSWEYMFKLLEPHKGFEIQRPNINASPNPPHSPQGRRPDSMA